MVDLAETIIDPCYANMKEDNDTKDLNTWEVPLNLAYITYAAKDAYACYDMYTQILDMRACLLPQNGQGSSRKQSNGKHHRNNK